MSEFTGLVLLICGIGIVHTLHIYVLGAMIMGTIEEVQDVLHSK